MVRGQPVPVTERARERFERQDTRAAQLCGKEEKNKKKKQKYGCEGRKRYGTRWVGFG